MAVRLLRGPDPSARFQGRQQRRRRRQQLWQYQLRTTPRSMCQPPRRRQPLGALQFPSRSLADIHTAPQSSPQTRIITTSGHAPISLPTPPHKYPTPSLPPPVAPPSSAAQNRPLSKSCSTQTWILFLCGPGNTRHVQVRQYISRNTQSTSLHTPLEVPEVISSTPARTIPSASLL